jgi:prepilin peptidase dependent protein B
MKTNQRGFNLIELMISIAVGLVVSAAVTTMFVSLTNSNVDYLKSIRLNHELRMALSMMARDIRRAGYNSNAVADLNSAYNPFAFSLAGATTLATALTLSGAALHFSYDEDADPSTIESFGFRLDADAVEACKASGSLCTNWEDITDADLVEVQSLTFNRDAKTDDNVTVEQLTVTIQGRLKADPTVSRTVSEVVKLRNDQLTAW